VRRRAARYEDRAAAAELCGRHKLATADAIVYATALEYGADLLTCDAHFAGLTGVVFIAKTKV
jgi:predicted nucleic acid-binding protein